MYDRLNVRSCICIQDEEKHRKRPQENMLKAALHFHPPSWWPYAHANVVNKERRAITNIEYDRQEITSGITSPTSMMQFLYFSMKTSLKLEDRAVHTFRTIKGMCNNTI